LNSEKLKSKSGTVPEREPLIERGEEPPEIIEIYCQNTPPSPYKQKHPDYVNFPYSKIDC